MAETKAYLSVCLSLFFLAFFGFLSLLLAEWGVLLLGFFKPLTWFERKRREKKMKSKENEASRMSEKEEKIERSSLIILSSTHPTHYIPHYSMYCNTVLLYVYCSTPFRSTQVHTYLVIYVSVRKKKPNPR